MFKLSEIPTLISVFFFAGALLHQTQTCSGQDNWKSRQASYVNLGGHERVLNERMLDNAAALIQYYGVDLEDMGNFKDNLDKILIPRVPGTSGSQIVRDHIKNTMLNLGWSVHVDNFTQQNTVLGHSVEFNNVISTLDENAPRRLIIACHYDSKITPKNFLGATDSAVPCAQMINLATVMHNDLRSLKSRGSEVTLQLVFFDGEEAFKRWTSTDSIYGSRHLADVWNRETGYRYQGYPPQGDKTLGRIDMLMLLDLLGTNQPEPTVLSSNQKTHNWYKRLRRIEDVLIKNSRAFGILGGTTKRIFTTKGDRAQRTGVEDDHIPFQKKGVPILHVIATPFPDVWHKQSDNARAVHLPTIEKLNKIFRMFVAEYLGL